MTDDRARRLREMRRRAGRGSDMAAEGDEDGETTEGPDRATSSGSSAADSSTTAPTRASAPAVDDGSGAETTDGGDAVAAEDDGSRASNDIGTGAPENDGAVRAEDNGSVNPEDDGTVRAEDNGSVNPEDDGTVRAEDEGTVAAEDEGAVASGSVSAPGGVGGEIPNRAAVTDASTGAAGLESVQGAVGGTSTMSSPGHQGDEPTVDASVAFDDVDEYGRATDDRFGEEFGDGQTLLHRSHDDEQTVQMLEFSLARNPYAIEIDRVSAIVEMKAITRFPRGPEAIDGVTDLRGEITGVLDPTALLDIERTPVADHQYIVVLDRSDDKQKLGFRVSDVSQAVTYRESQIDETAVAFDGVNGQDHAFVEGVIKKTVDGDTSLVTWLDVDAIIDGAN